MSHDYFKLYGSRRYRIPYSSDHNIPKARTSLHSNDMVSPSRENCVLSPADISACRSEHGHRVFLSISNAFQIDINRPCGTIRLFCRSFSSVANNSSRVIFTSVFKELYFEMFQRQADSMLM